MLVLSRKENERIVIDDTIVVTVVEIRGNKVRLGVQAPTEIGVCRYEVWVPIQEAGKTDMSRTQAREKASVAQ